MPLVLTFLSGLFFLVGIIIYNVVKDKSSFANLSVGCAFVVLAGLIAFDLVPEIVEAGRLIYLVFVILGLSILVLIDKLIPHHVDNHEENDDERK